MRLFVVSKLVYEHVNSHLIQDRIKRNDSDKYDLVPGDAVRISVEANGRVVIEKYGSRIARPYRGEQYITALRAKKLLFRVWRCINSKKSEKITVYDTCSREITLVMSDGAEHSYRGAFRCSGEYSTIMIRDFLNDLERKGLFSELFENYTVRT